MSGSVGESLSVSCRYEEKFKTKDKYWCRVSLKILCKDIVKTSSSEEARSGRVTIRDHPDNLTFTVTYESLTLEDADTYMCAVDISLFDGSLGFDKYFKIELSVVPSEDPGKSP
jgi:CD300 antigen